jgi:outer membrane protein TolC
VDNQLRPGADGSRADAERAVAQTRLIQAQETLTVAQATLSRVLGDAAGTVAVDAAPLLSQMPQADVPPAATASHPLAQARQASVGVARAQEDLLAHTDFPRLYLQSSVFARGSGANANGTLESGLQGLALDRANWAAGVQLVFPNVFDFGGLRARKAAAAATTREESALYDEAVLTLTSQQRAATAMLAAARAVARNTPVQLAAAQQSEVQARARYEAGLATLNELADSQSLLAQAEAQDQLARVDVWRALLAEALARGSLEPFVALIRP